MSSLTSTINSAVAVAARWVEENSDLSYAKALQYVDTGGFVAFQQLWPNTSCGFGGFAGQAFTTATTVIFFVDDDKGDEQALVVIAGRIAYVVEGGRGNKAFMLDVVNHKVVGQEEYLRSAPYKVKEEEDVREESSGNAPA